MEKMWCLDFKLHLWSVHLLCCANKKVALSLSSVWKEKQRVQGGIERRVLGKAATPPGVGKVALPSLWEAGSDLGRKAAGF